MKKIFTFLTILFCNNLYSQYTTIYENSFRNWTPGQGWVMINNDTISLTPGQITENYNGESTNYMLGIHKLSDSGDKIMITPPLILNNNPHLLFYSNYTPNSIFTLWAMRNENDTTLNGLTDSLRICRYNGFNSVDLNSFANDTIRLAFRLTGRPNGFIDDISVIEKTSLAWIPDSCFRNYLKTLSASSFINDSLDYLDQNFVNITVINNPGGCIQSLEGLQYIPNIIYINLPNNQISYMPLNTLWYLDSINISNNQVGYLPDLPGCTRLYLNNNVIRNIPDICNQQVAYFYARNNMIFDCLPPSNRFVWGDFYGNINVYFQPSYYYSNPNYYSGVLPQPVCTQLTGNVSGVVYYDMNQNGVKDSSDILLTNRRVDVQPDGDVFTNYRGEYSVTKDTGIVSANVIQLPPYFNCANPFVDTFSVQEYIHHDFRIVAPTPTSDLQVDIMGTGPVRIGEQLSLYIGVRNNGTAVENADVLFHLQPGFTVVAQQNGTITNDTLDWNISLNPFQSVYSWIRVRVDSAPANQFHIFRADVINSNDVNPVDNIDSLSVLIADSIHTWFPWLWLHPHDPNNKQVEFPVVAPGFNDFIEYNINFENTGTGNATRVMVRDKLSSLLDFNTFEFIGATHPCQVLLANDSVIEFLFQSILLTPDSIDSLNSSGSFWFRIKPRNAMQLNDTISNIAGIYFDSEAVVNTEVCQVWADTTYILSASSPSSNDLIYYPNPTSGLLNIKFKDPAGKSSDISITNIFGQTFDSKKYILNDFNLVSVDMKNLSSGIYFVTINMNGSKHVLKVMKQ